VVVTFVAIAVPAESQAATVLLVFLVGLSGFLVNPAVLGRVFAIAGDAPTLAGATNVSSMRLGITLAPLLGGLAIGAGFGIESVGWVGAVTAVVSIGAVLLDNTLHRRHTAAQDPAGTTAAS
jgi:DHA1 family chloramphenicol resistance protein-like MFS transporter